MNPVTVLVLLAALGCATTRPAPPPPIALLPPLPAYVGLVPLPAKPNPEDPKKPVASYPDTPIVSGRCKDLPAGMLVSHLSYAEFAYTLIERNHLRKEAATLLRLRNDEYQIALEIEQAYRARVAGLEQSLAQEVQGKTLRYLLAAAAGGLVVIGTVLATRAR